MENPPPVQITPQMKALLDRAKNVMKVVDTNKPIVLSETTEKQTQMEAAEDPETKAPLVPTSAAGYTREQVMNSKMPQAIKEAMLKSIPKEAPQPFNSRLEDMSDLEDIKMIPNKRKPILKSQTINENKVINSNSDMVTLSRTDLKDLINESINNFLVQSYNKNLTEDAIKKTINMLIKEGKLTVKKK
jgi:hypothetical protein